MEAQAMRDATLLFSLAKEARMEREAFLEKSKEACPFCRMRELRPEDIAIETEHFVALIDIAPPTPLYFVVYPKDHALAYYELHQGFEEEFDHLIKTIQLRTNHDSWIFFENGAGNRNGKGYGVVSHQSVYHAHVNMVGIPEGEEGVWEFVRSEFQRLDPSGERVKIYEGRLPAPAYPSRVLQAFTGGRPYFYQQQGEMVRIVMEESDEKIVPSQFVRRAISKYFNRMQDSPFWDWKNIDPIYKGEIEARKEAMRRMFW